MKLLLGGAIGGLLQWRSGDRLARETSMFKTFAVAFVATVAAATLGVQAQAADISGAGATFPAPVYAKWAEAYKAQTKNGLNYQAIGSGGGIKQIEANTVDFGASDKPLKLADLQANGLMQFPTVMGGVVPVMNLPGVDPGQVKLDGKTLAAIFLGDVKTWGDPRITSLNPGVKLPNLPITVVHRSDGSGTSFVFTTYLSNQLPAWAQRVGANDSVEWPTGLGGKGNDGVAAFVKQTVGSIGYVEYAYAKQNKLTYANMKNKAGQFVAPTAEAFASAASGADWTKAPGNYLLLLDQPGPKSWPITAATFILVHVKQDKPENAKEVLSFFDWAYKNGDAAAAQLDYVPLPAPVKAMMRKQWADQIKGADGKAIYAAK
jgi:phosphate transport system substrate-binding protein